MGAIIVGLRPGDHRRLEELAVRRGRPPKEIAGILLEQAIRQVIEEPDTGPDRRTEPTL